MSVKRDVIEVHAKHPNWHSGMIAEFLGVQPSTVREIGRSANLTFAPKTLLSVKRQFKRVRYAGWAGEGRGW